MTEQLNPTGTPNEILIVEDSPVEAEMLRRILVRAGYRVALAKNGEEGLQALREHPCALVISDINMPRMNGYELCHAIKLDEKLWSVPVILVTSLAEPKDIIMALDVGADGYVTKPYIEDILLGRIRSLLANPARRKLVEERRKIQVEYGGEKHDVAVGSPQMANLLLSVYENSLTLNQELMHIQNQLNVLNESLDEKVRERTAALQESEEKFRTATDTVLDAFIIIESEHGSITWCNSAAEAMFGYSKQEMIGRTLHEFLPPPRFREAAQHGLAHFAKTGEGAAINKTLELAALRKNGTEFPIDLSLSAMQINGKWYAIGTVRDITERKQAEEELQLRAQLLDGASDTIFVVDFNGNFVYLNEAAWRTRGYTLDEMMAMNLHVLDTPKYEKLIESRMNDLMEKGRCIFESEHRRKDGSVMPVEINARIVESGGRRLALSVIRDITERKQAEESVRISQARFSTIFNQAPLGIALIDSFTGKIYEVNLRFAEIAGRTIEEMTTINWMSITHPDDVQEDLDNMALLNAGKIPGFRMDKRYIHPDGSFVWINMTIAPLMVDKNISPRHLCMIEDITERKQASILINEQIGELQRWQDVTMGREMRTIELKHEVNELLGQAGQPPRYPSAEASAAAEGSLRSSGEPTGVPLADE